MTDVLVTGTDAVTPLRIGTRVLREGRAAGRSGIEDGATALGRIRGFDASSNGHHLTLRERVLVVRRALADVEAGAAHEDVVYVNARSMSTKPNDAAETAVIKLELGGHQHWISFWSLKSGAGHLLGGDSAVEAVASILALRDRPVAPTLTYGEPNAHLDLEYVPGPTRPLPANCPAPVALPNPVGCSGHNVVLAWGAA